MQVLGYVEQRNVQVVHYCTQPKTLIVVMIHFKGNNYAANSI